MDLLDALAEPALVLAGNRVIAANPPALALLGEHVVDEDLRLTLRHPDAVALLQSERLGAIEMPGLRDAKSRWQLRVARAGRGQRLVQLTDVSAQAATDRARTDFVANASHELRTPLTAIRGFVETLQDEDTATDPHLRARFLGIVAREAQRMERLIEDLIELSRIEAEKAVPPSGLIDLAALVADVVSEYQGADGAPDAQLVVNLAEAAAVRADPVQLAQVVRNLVDNARRYGGGSPIRIRTGWSGDQASISVTDSGAGIDAHHLPRLTERFYRVDAARSRETGGTGLGLAIVKHIVERHKGRLVIESRKGQGTTVTVLLPPA